MTPNGNKWWRLKYRFGGKEKTLSIGVYPVISTKDAREIRDKARNQIALGVEPLSPKKAARLEAQATGEVVKNSFESVAREWHNTFKSKWVPYTAEKILSRFENDIFPILGAREITAITPSELLAALRGVEARGANETAHRILQDCGRVFRFGIATGSASRDIAADLKGALAPFQNKNFATIIEPKKIGELLRAIDIYTGVIVRCALQLAPLVFVRPGELRNAKWSEFNFETNEWRIPAVRMKMRQDHIVPLARQSVAILNELNQYSYESEYLFPSMRSNHKPISDATLLNGLRILGYAKEEMTVHGFRSMASTLLNERGYNRDWIERQMAHSERNRVRAAYNYAEYLSERRKMMQEWADYLDTLKAIH